MIQENWYLSLSIHVSKFLPKSKSISISKPKIQNLNLYLNIQIYVYIYIHIYIYIYIYIFIRSHYPNARKHSVMMQGWPWLVGKRNSHRDPKQHQFLNWTRTTTKTGAGTQAILGYQKQGSTPFQDSRKSHIPMR